MADLFNPRNISFYTPKTQWDPIFRYYNSILGTESGNIDLMPQVRVEADPEDPNKFVVQWSLGGFGRDIPGTPLKEYNPPNLTQLNEWLYSMEGDDYSEQFGNPQEKPYFVENSGLSINFPREIHDFALSALTGQGDILYLGEINAENINDPTLAQALDMPYWGVRSNRIPVLRHAISQVAVQKREACERETIRSLTRDRQGEDYVPTRGSAVSGPSDYDKCNDLPWDPAHPNMTWEASTLITWGTVLDTAVQDNNNRPFWKVLIEGTRNLINPDRVAAVYNLNNPPPRAEVNLAPRTLGNAVPTIYDMLSQIPNLNDDQHREFNELLARAVREQIGIGLRQRYENISSDDVTTFVHSTYFGSRIQTPFVIDSKSAKYLQLENMSELAGSDYGLVRPTYNRYEPCLENAGSYENIDENNLVSFYTLMGSVNYNILDNKKVPSGWVSNPQSGNFVYNKYQNISTLSGSVDANLLNIARTSLSKYFKSYMNAIPDVRPADLSQLGRLYQRAKFPDKSSDFLTDYDFNQPLMPYYIQVNLLSGEAGVVVEEINKSSLSSYILDKTQKSESLSEDILFGNSTYTVETDCIDTMGQGVVVHRKKDIPLRGSTLRQVLGHSTDRGISDLSYNIVGEDAIAGSIADGFTQRKVDKLLQLVRRKSSSELLSYQDRVENKHFTDSESLLDVISKTKDGSSTPIAKTYIASPTLQKVHQYTDTQVKYGEKYTYKNSKMNLVYGTKYSYKTLDITVPISLLQSSEDSISQDVPDSIFIDYGMANAARSQILTDEGRDNYMPGTPLPGQTVGYSFCVEVQPADSRILNIPIYDQVYETFAENPAGVSFSPVSVLDYPPTPPVLEIRPIRGNYRQVLINLNLEAVSRTTTDVINGPQCLEGVDYDNLHQYQKTFIDFTLEDGKLIFQNDGLSEITNVKVVRTDKLIASAYEAENPIEEAYKSFCEDTNPEAEIVTKSLSQEYGQVAAGSYGFLDDIEPNKYYYYTAFSRDLRDNVSNPSEIYQVRLVYDKGFLSPEISIVNIEEIPNKTPVKKMTRFMEIKASGIQTQPFMEAGEDGEIESYKSLIYKAGEAGDLPDITSQQVTESDFVVRLTSKDTGRKFDIRLAINETHPIPDQGDPDSC